MEEKSTATPVSNELYDALAPEISQELKSCEQEITAPAGTKLISHGITPESLIIIKQGSVEISVPAGSRAVFLAVAGGGKVLGLRGVVSEVKPEIDVTTLEECRIALIPRNRFLEILKAHPESYFAVSRVLSGDLKAAERLLREKPRGADGKSNRAG